MSRRWNELECTCRRHLSGLEPVTLVGTAFFDTPQGPVTKIFTEYVPQPG